MASINFFMARPSAIGLILGKKARMSHLQACSHLPHARPKLLLSRAGLQSGKLHDVASRVPGAIPFATARQLIKADPRSKCMRIVQACATDEPELQSSRRRLFASAAALGGAFMTPPAQAASDSLSPQISAHQWPSPICPYKLWYFVPENLSATWRMLIFIFLGHLQEKLFRDQSSF